MSDIADAFDAAAQRLLGEQVTPALLRDAEAGHWPAALWDAVQSAGLTRAALPEAAGGAAAGWADLFAVVRAAGQHALPLPLPEALLAHALLARCGLAAGDGVLTLAPHATLQVADGRVSGRLDGVPWGRQAAQLLAVTGGDEGGAGGGPAMLWLLDAAQARVERQCNVAGEPRDSLGFSAALPLASAALPADLPPDVLMLYGAMLRSAQTAGALDAVLALCLQQATLRVQFGKPIAAFQAIQHQVAVLAEHVACAGVAAEAAFAGSAQAPAVLAIAAAKVCSAEAAGAAAGIAHAVHGAIGFTHAHALQHLTRRLWAWRSEFGNHGHWSQRLGHALCAAGSTALWPAVTSGRLPPAAARPSPSPLLDPR